jgi:hypothetical protein
MAYTALLGLLQPTTGSLGGTWGTAVNNQITQLIEDAIAGAATQDVTSGDWTLTNNNGATDTARMSALIASGTPGTLRYINAPEQNKLYVVVNNSDSTVQLRGGVTPTTGVPILSGQAALCVWTGTDFLKVAGGSGGATGGGTDQIFFNNGQTVTANYTIPSNTNSGTFGPVSVNSGVTVTVPTSSSWTVV